MKLKKSLAVLLSAVLMLSFLPLFASASDAPTALYVGEKGKTGDNLIQKLEEDGLVNVSSVNDASSWYTVCHEKGAGYVLTFYNHYKISQPVERSGGYYGVYCDGDLTIRVCDGVTLDLDQKFGGEKYDYACGIYVKGTLTMEGIGSKPVMQVRGDCTQSESGAVGIYAESLRLYNIRVCASGGYAAVESKEAIAMINADLYANNTADMKNAKGEPLFSYGVVTDNFIQVGGAVEVGGEVDIDAYDFHGGTQTFDVDFSVYLRSYTFKPNSDSGRNMYDGLWRESFDLFVNASLIPSCFELVKEGKGSVVTVNGSKATLSNKGAVTLSLVLVCGNGSYLMDTYEVNCNIAWWQWIPYIFSGAWLNK